MQDRNIEYIKTGDELCVIYPNGGTGAIYTVGEFSDSNKRFRLQNAQGKPLCWLPIDGEGYKFMRGPADGEPDFYYSANPVHVEKAKQNIRVKQEKEKQQEAQNWQKLEDLRSKIDALLTEYGATIEASQTESDSHGVEVGLFLSIGRQSLHIDK